MVQKIIQDIYVVKKSIRMIKKSDVHDGFYSHEKKTPTEIGKDKDFVNVTIHKINNSKKEHIIKEIEDQDIKHQDLVVDTEYDTGDKKHVTKNSLFFLVTLSIVAVATLLFVLSSMFSTATLTITPRSERVVLNDTYAITNDKTVGTSTLHFEVMSIQKTSSKDLETDGEEYKEIKATGKAVLFNNFSSASQRIINNTRLETKDGLTYRIRESVEIPGIKNGLPGSTTIDIIADMPGDKYNMDLEDLKGDFTIPGFKGTPKSSKIFARLVSGVSGGFVGDVKKVSEEKLVAGRADIKDQLTKDLTKEIFSKKPDSYILFKDNYYIRCSDLPDESAGNSYKVSEECSVNAVVFNKEVLAAFIAKNKIKDFNSAKVDLMWGDENTVSLLGTSEKPWNENSIKAKFSGPLNIVWSYNIDAIKSSIIGYDKSIISSVIENNKSYIKEIVATIRPMWKNTFPANTKKIKIVDIIRDGEL